MRGITPWAEGIDSVPWGPKHWQHMLDGQGPSVGHEQLLPRQHCPMQATCVSRNFLTATLKTQKEVNFTLC